MRQRLTRRNLLIAGSALVGSTLLTSCTSSGEATPVSQSEPPPARVAGNTPATPGTPASTQQTPAAGEAPRQGGILALHHEADPSTFDVQQNTTEPFILIPCFDGLVQYDPLDDTKIVPNLAERWEISDNRTVYTFHLKAGVQFHDESPLTSYDVKVSLERIIAPPPGFRSPRQLLFDAVESIDAPDEATVVINLSDPDESLLVSLAQGWNAIYPAKLVESGADLSQPASMVGTGPFRFKNYTPGVSVELERNPNYHVPGHPLLDGITMYIIPDPNAVMNAFLSGQLHFYRPLSVPAIDLLQAQAGDDLSLNQTLSPSTYGVDLQSERLPAWKDPRVRLAASLAIDRYAALQVINKGFGKVSGYMHPDGSWALPPERLEQAAGYSRNHEENLARARQLLEEAGYADEFDVILLTARGERNETPMTFVRDQWAKIGIRAHLDVADLPVFIQRRYTDRDYDACQSVHVPAVDDPKALFSPWLDCSAPNNVTALCDESINDLYRQQAREGDRERRKQIIQELDFRCLDEIGGGRIMVHRALAWDI